MHIHTIQLNIEKLIGGTAHMDATEFGAYLSLIVCAYQKKNSLPDEDKRLARMAKCSPRVWARIRETVAEKFQISGGYWSHIEVGKQLDKYQKLSRKNRANALKKNKTQKPAAKPKENQTEANTNNNHQLPNNISNTNVLESSGKPDLPSSLLMSDGRFLSPDKFCEDLWQIYPSVGRGKGHKGKFFEQVKEQLKKGIDHEEIRAGVTRYAEYCTTTGELNKDAFRWVRDAEWQNDYTTSAAAHRPHKVDGPHKTAGSLAQIIDAGEKAKEIIRRQDAEGGAGY